LNFKSGDQNPLKKTGRILKSLVSRKKNLNKIKMKNLFLMATMFLMFGAVKAQKVYAVSRESYADVKVFVVDRESYADLLVYKVDRESYAGKNDGKWFFVDRESYAQKKIYFVDRESYADLKIYFVNRESYAGWRNSAKKSLMY
jgi:hypothetical protein